MAEHTRAEEVGGRYTQIRLGKLHSYDLADFQCSSAIVCLLLSPLLGFFFNFDLILHTMLVAMQALQAQPPLHGCVQLGCSGHFAD